MLVLTRKAQETILIGDDIKVVLIWADGGKASIGVQAPAGTVIDRGEIRAAPDYDPNRRSQKSKESAA